MNSGDTLAPTVASQNLGLRAAWRALPRTKRLRISTGSAWAVVITIAFVEPLARLMQYAVGSELHSYIPLVPVITAYLLYLKPPRRSPRRSRQDTTATAMQSLGASRRRFAAHGPAFAGMLVLAAIGAAALAGAIQWPERLSVNDELALVTLAYVCFLTAGGLLFLGWEWMAAAAFPVAFLIFLVPLPDRAVYWLETRSVLASADVAEALFKMTGTPLVREGTVFALPGIVLQVAQECSGIHSSWVLFITSLVASHLFLQSPWRRIALVAFVIPLAVVRNGFRILVIGLLCVRVGPHMIDSVIHRRGGPLFFLLSLVPLFLVMLWLRRQEQQPGTH